MSNPNGPYGPPQPPRMTFAFLRASVSGVAAYLTSMFSEPAAPPRPKWEGQDEPIEPDPTPRHERRLNWRNRPRRREPAPDEPKSRQVLRREELISCKKAAKAYGARQGRPTWREVREARREREREEHAA